MLLKLLNGPSRHLRTMTYWQALLISAKSPSCVRRSHILLLQCQSARPFNSSSRLTKKAPENETARRPWTEENRTTIRAMRAEKHTWKTIAEAQGRSDRAAQKFFSMRKPTESETFTWKPWTQEESDTLIALRREGLTIPSIASRLGRTRASIDNRIRRMQNRPHTTERARLSMRSLKPWTAEELEIARKCRTENHSCSAIAAKLGRTKQSVQRRLAPSTATRVPKNWFWTREEDEKLRSLWVGGSPWSQLLANFPHKSRSSIEMHILNLGLHEIGARPRARPWAKPEIDLLCDLVTKGYSYPAIAGMIEGRSAMACKEKGRTLGFSRTSKSGKQAKR